MSDNRKQPTVLIILDGWGHREETRDNAIANGNTPVWDRLWSQAPRTLVSGSGLDVGLPAGQMGNSEVGHMSLGAGRVIYQNITRIDQAIRDGSFNSNPVFTSAIDKATANDGAVTVASQLDPAAQARATRLYGYDASHTGILSDKASVGQIHKLLREAGDGRS